MMKHRVRGGSQMESIPCVLSSTQQYANADATIQEIEVSDGGALSDSDWALGS